MTELLLIVPPGLDGERADKAVATLADIPRSMAKEIFDAEGAAIDDVPVKASQRIGGGDEISVVIPERVTTIDPDPSVPFDVLYEDADLLIVDKPIGVVVHPTSDRSSGTLVHGLISRYPEIVGIGQEGRWGIVHRLDRDTSGLLAVARSTEGYEGLTALMRERAVNRRYLAVVAGHFDSTTGTIDAPIARDPSNPTRMRVDRAGRSSRTNYRRLATWDGRDASLISVGLETGRTHQIRVHMRSIDHPIIGDRAYGKAGTVGDPGRPWLHARQLSFAHPVSGKAIDIVSGLPEDLGDSLSVLGEPDAGELEDIDGRAL
ncbi:MAG: RluA family pseudouridine synthase [Acidimicrobiia bacterium]